MKKIVMMSALILALAGCGTNENELTSVKEQNEKLQAQVTSMEVQIKNLQAQLEELATMQEEEVQAVMLETITSNGNSYLMTNVTVEPKEDENVYEAMLRTLFPILTFNYVTENGDGTITIDIHKNSTGSPNMTASAQVSTFLDQLEYTLQENFKELNGYFITSNGATTYLGDFGPLEELRKLGNLTEDKLYLPISK